MFGFLLFNQNLDSIEVFDAPLGQSETQELRIAPRAVNSTSIGLFGNSNIHITEHLDLTLGARWTSEYISGWINATEEGPVQLWEPFSYSESNRDSKFTGTVGLKYLPTDQVMFYATYATGYKSPAFSAGTTQSSELPSTIVPPESSTSLEAGVKSQWFDNRLRLNMTVFDTEFEDFQGDALITLPGSLVPTGIISSIPKLGTKGVEVEVNVAVTEDLDVGAGYGYTDAKFSDFDNSPCYSGQTPETGCIDGLQDLSGRNLPYQGENQYNIFFDYSRDFSQFRLFAKGNYSWMDERHTSWQLAPKDKVDAVGLLSARIGASFSDGRWDLALFGTNLTDENYTTKVLFSGLTGGYLRFVGMPRVIGLSASVRY